MPTAEFVRAATHVAETLLGPAHPNFPRSRHVLDTIAALTRVGLKYHDRAWLATSIKAAKQSGATKRGGDVLQFTKGVLANKSGNRDLFFARFDEELLAIVSARSPPASVNPRSVDARKQPMSENRS